MLAAWWPSGLSRCIQIGGPVLPACVRIPLLTKKIVFFKDCVSFDRGSYVFLKLTKSNEYIYSKMTTVSLQINIHKKRQSCFLKKIITLSLRRFQAGSDV